MKPPAYPEPGPSNESRRLSSIRKTPGRLALLLAILTATSAPAETLARKDGQSAESFAEAVKKWPAVRGVEDNLARMIVSYPQAFSAFETEGPGQPVTARLQGSSRVVFEDQKKKSFNERIDAADIGDMLSDSYPSKLPADAWPENLDPGRYRCTAFLKAVYGATEADVARNLVKVPFCGKTVSFNRLNGAAAALAAAGKELEDLAKKDPSLKPYLEKLGGTFAWRVVAGTQLLSAHCFSIAIDLNPDLGGYWRWEKRDLAEMGRRVKYPPAIVEVFEKHGFIWGGKWYHFDLMHFEFRPEFAGRNPWAAREVAEVPKSGAAHSDSSAVVVTPAPVLSREPAVTVLEPALKLEEFPASTSKSTIEDAAAGRLFPDPAASEKLLETPSQISSEKPRQ